MNDAEYRKQPRFILSAIACILLVLTICINGNDQILVEDVNDEIAFEENSLAHNLWTKGNEAGGNFALQCCDGISNIDYVLVSTMNGQISALDANSGGKLVWTLENGVDPLLSGTLSSTTLFDGGLPYNLVPALDGTLYMFADDILRPVPFNAQMLLHGSVRIGTERIAGSSSQEIVGLNALTGKIRYRCSPANCAPHENVETDADHILVFTRQSHIVRALNAVTGIERWNLTVAEYQADVARKGPHIEDRSIQNPHVFFQLRPPDGVVTAVDSCGSVMWQSTLASPIARVWRYRGGSLTEISLFESKNIELPNDGAGSTFFGDVDTKSPLYIGTLNYAPYIIPSDWLRANLKGTVKFPYRHPGISTAPAQLEIAHDEQTVFRVSDNGIANVISKECTRATNPRIYDNAAVHMEHERCALDNTALDVIDSNDVQALSYENSRGDRGFHVFLDKEKLIANDMKANKRSRYTAVGRHMAKSLYADEFVSGWWRAAALISMFLLVTVIFVVLYRRSRRLRKQQLLLATPSTPSVATNTNTSFATESMEKRSTRSSQDGEIFVSKFLSDFTVVKCLGRGGFGIVFETVNRLDDCSYAVKRIAVSDSSKAIERVRREVRALAKLDHPGIVRYYHTWLERPPQGWQEARDLENSIAGGGTDRFSFISNKNREAAPTFQNVSSSGKNSFSSKNNSSTSSCSSTSSSGSTNKNCPPKPDASESIVFAHGSTANSKAVFDDTAQRNCLGLRAVLIDNENDDLEICTSPRSFVCLYIQMQLCQDKNLKDWLTANKLLEIRQSTLMLNWFAQLVSAISYVHDQGLIHRDLKPSNIFFDSNNRLRIGDFGLATAYEHSKLDDDHDVSPPALSIRHTNNVGTRLYMSPEQTGDLTNNASYDHKVDIFSLGLIFTEMRVPFSTDMERIVTLKNVRERKMPPSMKPEECRFVTWLTSTAPADRPDCAAIIESEILRGEMKNISYICYRDPFDNRNPSASSLSSISTGDKSHSQSL